MSLSELGNLGELIGGVAVIGSLIYLAIQVRQATRAQRTESFQAALGKVNDWWRSIAENSELARIHLDGLADFAGLKSDEQMRFHAHLMEVLVVCEMMFRMGEGLLNAPTLAARDRFISELFGHPGVQTWWREQGRPVFSEDFRDYIEQLTAA